MRYFLTLLFYVLMFQTVIAQPKRDSILLYERSIDRPLTLHKGQMRINSSYGLALFNKRFNSNGDIVKLSDEGLTKVRHTLLFEVKYALNDFIQFNAQIANKTENQRGNSFFVLTDNDAISIYNLKEVKGFDDVQFSVDLRAPFNTKKIDLVTTFGATLPSAKSTPSKPNHSIETFADGNSEYSQLTYHNINHWGNNVPVIITGLRGKFRAKKWAYNGSIEYRHALKESKSNEWKYQLYDSIFEYYQWDYKYQIPDQFFIGAEVEYQALPWINTFLGFDLMRASSGWTGVTNQTIAIANSQLISIHGGLEILITHKLWWRGSVSISPWGKSTYSPFLLHTTVSYNLFP